MDLKSVRKNLGKNKYKIFSEFFRDVQLIWDNCKTYNMQGSDIYKMAESMEKVSKRSIAMCKEKLGFGKDGASKKDKKKKDKKRDSDDPMAAGSDEEEEKGNEESASDEDE